MGTACTCRLCRALPVLEISPCRLARGGWLHEDIRGKPRVCKLLTAPGVQMFSAAMCKAPDRAAYERMQKAQGVLIGSGGDVFRSAQHAWLCQRRQSSPPRLRPSRIAQTSLTGRWYGSEGKSSGEVLLHAFWGPPLLNPSDLPQAKCYLRKKSVNAEGFSR